MDVDESVDLICLDTGISATPASDDREKALACYNRAYRRIVLETRCIKAFGRHALASLVELSLNDFASFGPGESLSDATATFSDRFFGADHVWYAAPEAADIWHPGRETLKRLPLDKVIFNRSASISTQPPTCYALQSHRLHLDSAPDSDGSYVVIYGSMAAPTLTEASVEDDVVGISPMYHEDLICALAICYVLEGYEGQEERARYYRTLYRETMDLFKDDQIRQGGVRLPNHGIDAWSTQGPSRQR